MLDDTRRQGCGNTVLDHGDACVVWQSNLSDCDKGAFVDVLADGTLQ